MVLPLLFSLMLRLDLNSGLAIQEYKLLEVKFDLGAMSLFEELGSSLFKFDCRLFDLHLRELESIAKLKV
jgi:hypothetical protein